MKNQYFGDENDFRKYVILSKLANSTGLRLCVVWMLTAADQRPDGGKITYQHQPERWRSAAPELFDFLVQCVSRNRRSVTAMTKCPGFSRTVFCNELLGQTIEAREHYFRNARKMLEGCGLVFFDPDNGLFVQSIHW